jgi:hypothetical protein
MKNKGIFIILYTVLIFIIGFFTGSNFNYSNIPTGEAVHISVENTNNPSDRLIFTGNKRVDFMALINDPGGPGSRPRNITDLQLQDNHLVMTVDSKLTDMDIRYYRAIVESSFKLSGLNDELDLLHLSLKHNGGEELLEIKP